MPFLKAVIDTSVMVSVAFAKEGVAKTLKDLIINDAFILITSKAILKEHNVTFSNDECVILPEEKIITCQGPAYAKSFGQAISNAL